MSDCQSELYAVVLNRKVAEIHSLALKANGFDGVYCTYNNV